MELHIILIVFLSSLIHASWNFLAKTIPSTTVFIWLVAVGCTVIYLPFMLVFAWYENFLWNVENLIALFFTSVLHIVYFWVLQKGYQVSDLSVVYPIARGIGPTFSTIGAVLFFHEKYSYLSIIGLLFIILGVLLIAGFFDRKEKKNLTLGIFYGILTGVLISFYTLWDSYCVKILKMSPFWIEYAAHPIRLIFFLPLYFRKKEEVISLWRTYKLKISIISIISPISFVLFLYAVQFAPISYLAPARELSIVIGVILGAKLLTEKSFYPRLFGSLAIIIGIICLSYYR